MRWIENEKRPYIIGCACMLLGLMLLAVDVRADPLQDLDRTLFAIKEPIATAASVCSLAVNIQVAFGEDNVQSKCNIRKVSEPINKVSRKRDTLAGTSRHIALVWRQLTH